MSTRGRCGKDRAATSSRVLLHLISSTPYTFSVPGELYPVEDSSGGP